MATIINDSPNCAKSLKNNVDYYVKKKKKYFNTTSGNGEVTKQCILTEVLEILIKKN